MSRRDTERRTSQSATREGWPAHPGAPDDRWFEHIACARAARRIGRLARTGTRRQDDGDKEKPGR